MKAYYVFIGLFALALIEMIVFGFYSQPLIPFIADLFSSPWGIVTSLDLVLGLVLFSSIVYLNEDSKKNAIVWILGIFSLGNPVAAAYCLMNLHKIRDKLGKRTI